MQLAFSHGYNEIWQTVNAHNSTLNRTGTKIPGRPCLGKYELTVWPATKASSVLNKEMHIKKLDLKNMTPMRRNKHQNSTLCQQNSNTP